MEYLRQAEELAHFAQYVELETRKGRELGHLILDHIDEVSTKKEMCACFICGNPRPSKLIVADETERTTVDIMRQVVPISYCLTTISEERSRARHPKKRARI